MKCKREKTLDKDFFKQKLIESGLNTELFAVLTCTTNKMVEYYWLVKKEYPIPHYIEPILNLLIELKEKYEASGETFDFLKENPNSLERKREEALKEFKESKKIFALNKENKILKDKILVLKDKLVKKRSKKNEKLF